MNNFSTPSKAKRWASASRGIIKEQALLLDLYSVDVHRLVEARWGTELTASDIELIMTCVWQIINSVTLAAMNGNPAAATAIKAMNKIIASYRNGMVPNGR